MFTISDSYKKIYLCNNLELKNNRESEPLTFIQV